ncbi:AHH domain-containing protein [Cystobacter fuscus]|uniref:AHH domain-containing protein n=1 Tax=Cystobacter fuscus TaxID=43 RepID=UPI002B2F2F45|nr:hypothetical protein F0U63_25130 [Cystobacter fuscus]
MKSASVLLRLLTASSFVLASSCATPGPTLPGGERPQPAPFSVQATVLPGEQLQLDFEPAPLRAAQEVLPTEEARQLLAEFLECAADPYFLPVVPAMASSTRGASSGEARLRAEFLARYGPGWLPLPKSLERSPLFMALRLSPRYMAPGIRDAALELFRSPLFLTSVTLSILVYFSAWVLPEPLFSKAFAATLTARLAFVVGLLELRTIALSFVRFYREVQAARTTMDVEAAAERFGRAMGGTALRVLVTAASFGVARSLPNVPPGGLGSLLGPPRFALAGGGSVQSAATAHVVADGTIVLTGAALGAAGSAVGSACDDGSMRKKGYRWHHLATDKNEISSARGGPWTPLFQRLFAKAGMSLDAAENLVYLKRHQGPHPEDYHDAVYTKLDTAMEQCRTVSHCRARLVEALRQLAEEVCTPGSKLHRLATR